MKKTQKKLKTRTQAKGRTKKSPEPSAAAMNAAHALLAPAEAMRVVAETLVGMTKQLETMEKTVNLLAVRLLGVTPPAPAKQLLTEPAPHPDSPMLLNESTEGAKNGVGEHP